MMFYMRAIVSPHLYLLWKDNQRDHNASILTEIKPIHSHSAMGASKGAPREESRRIRTA